MQLSEGKAKKILEFLASKCNCYLKQFIDVSYNEYVLLLGSNKHSKFNYWWLYSIGISDGTGKTSIIHEIITPQMSYAGYLDKCLDIASKSYDIFVGGQMFIRKDTTLEQILIDMDMNNL